MQDFVLGHEPAIRLGAFLGVFVLLALLERLVRWREPALSVPRRWLANLGIVAVNTLAVRLLLPVLAVGAASFAEARDLGLLPALSVPPIGRFVASVLLLDLAVYLQHRLFHAIRPLWRIHAMHHADPELDVTTGARFHPLEILLSAAIKMVVVVALGAPPSAVVAFEVLLNATAMFNHSNIRLPASLDRILRLVVVTPDMHRVHHSVIREEHDKNFGFNLPWWDRLLGTYRKAPAAGPDGVTLGLDGVPRTAQGLGYLLSFPFKPMPKERP